MSLQFTVQRNVVTFTLKVMSMGSDRERGGSGLTTRRRYNVQRFACHTSRVLILVEK